MVKRVDKLTPKMITAINMYVANPSLTIADISRELGKHYNTVYNWFCSPVFKEEVERRFKEAWAEAAKVAQNRMIDLMNNGEGNVSFNATKYIMDCNGFKAPEKVELSGGMDIEINISNDKA